MKPNIKILQFNKDLSADQTMQPEEMEDKTNVDISKLEREICAELTEVANLKSAPQVSQPNSTAVPKQKKGKDKSSELICPPCGFRCQTKKELKRHLKCHAEQKSFKCSKCVLEFPKKSLLKKHLKSHLEDAPVKDADKRRPRIERNCPHCPFTTKQRSTFNKHIKICQTAPRLKCSECEFTCLTRRELLKHIPSAHLNEDYKTCPECGYVASSLSSLEKHQLVHFSPQVYECSLCMFVTKYPASLDRHIKFVHLNERMNQCPLCDYKSKEKGDLNKHMRVHGYSIYCPYCREKFTRVEKFQDHSCVEQFLETQQVYECFPDSLHDIFSSSSNNRNFESYVCFECTREFDNKELLSRHMMRRHPQKCSFLCWLCGFCFNSFKKMREHACKVKERNDNPLSLEQRLPSKHKKSQTPLNKNSQIIYRCPDCDFQAKFVKSLTYHTKTVHGKDDEIFQCSQCSYKGKRKYDITKHEMTVHQKSTYMCSKCGTSFEQLKKLRLHSCNPEGGGAIEGQTSETDDEAYDKEMFKCTLCSFTCSDHGRVIRHYQCVHENIRPYSCSQCKYKAKEKGDLKKHFIWVHATVRGPYICSKCKQSFILKTHLRTHDCAGKTPRRSVKRTPPVKQPKKEDLVDKLFLCPHCNFETKYSESIARHMECVHEGKRPYPCPKCDHKSKERGDLKKHLARVHSIDNPYFCIYCHLSFKFHHELKTHACIATYTKEEKDSDVIDLLATKVPRPKVASPAFMVSRDSLNIKSDESPKVDDNVETICSPVGEDAEAEADALDSLENSGTESPSKVVHTPIVRISRDTNLLSRSDVSPHCPIKTVTIRRQKLPSKSVKRQASSRDAISFVEDSLMGGNKKVKVIAFNPDPDPFAAPSSPSGISLAHIKTEPEDVDSNDSCDFVGFDAIPHQGELGPVMHEVTAIQCPNDGSGDSTTIHKEIKKEYDTIMYDYENETVVHEVTVGQSENDPYLEGSTHHKDDCGTVVQDYTDETVMHEITVAVEEDSKTYASDSSTIHKDDLNYIKQICDTVMNDAAVANENVIHEVTVEQSRDDTPAPQEGGDPSKKEEESPKAPLKVIKISETKLQGLSCLGCKFFCHSLNELLVHLQNH